MCWCVCVCVVLVLQQPKQTGVDFYHNNSNNNEPKTSDKVHGCKAGWLAMQTFLLEFPTAFHFVFLPSQNHPSRPLKRMATSTPLLSVVELSARRRVVRLPFVCRKIEQSFTFNFPHHSQNNNNNQPTSPTAMSHPLPHNNPCEGIGV